MGQLLRQSLAAGGQCRTHSRRVLAGCGGERQFSMFPVQRNVEGDAVHRIPISRAFDQGPDHTTHEAVPLELFILILRRLALVPPLENLPGKPLGAHLHRKPVCQWHTAAIIEPREPGPQARVRQAHRVPTRAPALLGTFHRNH